MNVTRLVILLIALGAGAGAFFLVSSPDNSAVETVVETVVPRTEGPRMARVLMASADVAQGAALTEDGTKWVDWPEHRVPEFYVTQENTEFLEALPQMRASRLIREHEPIYTGNTVRPGDRGMMAAIMTPGMRAVSTRVTEEEISGGFVLPGDRVDIYASGTDPSQPDATATSWVLYSNVRVLAIDQSVAQPEGAAAIVGRTVTLELEPGQVQRFIEARDTATLTLVLRSVFEPEVSNSSVQQPTPDEVVVIRYGSG